MVGQEWNCPLLMTCQCLEKFEFWSIRTLDFWLRDTHPEMLISYSEISS